MNIVKIIILIVLITSCGSTSPKEDSDQMITNAQEQKHLFNSLMTVAANSIQQNEVTDSLSILLLPVQASCPSCRKKTIDSIITHIEDIKHNQYIIISANGGRKIINSYFREENAELPAIPGRIIIDSNNKANGFKLYDSNPAMYYTADGKVYKKVLASPSTIRKDLHDFFSR